MVNESCLKQIKPLLHGGPDYPTEIKFGKNGCCCATGYNFRVGANGNIINYQCTKMTSCIDSEYYERFGIGFPKFLTSSGHEKIGVSGWISEKIEGQELILLHPTNCRFKYGNACFKCVTACGVTWWREPYFSLPWGEIQGEQFLVY